MVTKNSSISYMSTIAGPVTGANRVSSWTNARLSDDYFVALVTELFIDTGFGQIRQFGYTIVFYWQVAFPCNQAVFMTEFGDIPTLTSRKLRPRPRSA